MRIKTALILCAGFGKRLNPLTLEKPKPLLKLNNLTLLENTIIFIEKLGIKKIILNTFYLRDQIEFFLKKKKFKASIQIIHDGKKILNTGGGIMNMIANSQEQDFFVFNPDTVWDFGYLKSIKEMEIFYKLNKVNNILLLVNKKLSFDQTLKGDFKLDFNKIKNSTKNDYIYTGCQIINKNLFKSINKKNFSILELWKKLIKKKHLFGFETKNNFYHVTNLKIYNKLLKSY